MRRLLFSLGIGNTGAGSAATAKSILGGTLLFDMDPAHGVSLNGSQVAQFLDQSGTGDANKNGTAAGSLQPTFNAINSAYLNLPTFDFSLNNRLLTGTWATPLTQPYTCWIVGNTNNGTTNNRILSTSSAATIEMYDSGANLFASSDGANSVITGSTTLHTPSVLYFVANGASSKVAVRRKTPEVTSNAGTGNPPLLSIGAYGPATGFGWGGPAARIIISAGTPSVQTISQMMSFLGSTYGIAIGA